MVREAEVSEPHKIKMDGLKLTGQPVLLMTTGGVSTPEFEFDGHKFRKPMDPLSMSIAMSSLHLAKKARGGDRDAVRILEALQVIVKTADGSVYYPPNPSEVEDQNRVWREGGEE